MKSLDIALQNIQTWMDAYSLRQEEASAKSIKQSYKLWRENGVWYSAVHSLIVEN